MSSIRDADSGHMKNAVNIAVMPANRHAPPSGARSPACTLFAYRPSAPHETRARGPYRPGALACISRPWGARSAQLAAWLPTAPDGYHTRPCSPIRHREQGPRVARYPHRRQGRFSLCEPSGPVRTPMRRTQRPARTRARRRAQVFRVHGPGAGITAGSCGSGPRCRSCLPLAAPQGSAELRRGPQDLRRRHARYEPPSPLPHATKVAGDRNGPEHAGPRGPGVEGSLRESWRAPGAASRLSLHAAWRCRRRGIG